MKLGKRGDEIAPWYSGLFFQTIDVSQQFFVIRHAAEVPADHFVSSQRWLSPRPQADQHAGDDCAVHLNLDAVLRMAQ